MNRLRLAYVRFTSCCGCQLTLLNSEAELAALDTRVDFVLFPMASSAADDGGPLALTIVEGSISRPEEVEELLVLRERSSKLAAIGACALTGGVNALASRDRGRLSRQVYGGTASEKHTFPPQPVSHFVRVDLEIAGCPPERRELLWTVGSLLQGGLPDLPSYPVCMECRQRENLCLLLERQEPCLGPVTRAGCDALCPSFGAACEGCRGAVAEANRREEFRLLLEAGYSEKEIAARMERFIGRGYEDSAT